MSTRDFYDELTPYYHLIFQDWDASMSRQGKALQKVLRKEVPGAIKVLDLACGIGTQSLALAQLGYQVTAEDLSPTSVARAKREAKLRCLRMKFGVGDMRSASRRHRGTFDAVIACDNAVPHLLSDREILGAFKAARACLKPGGLYLISVRDYVAEDRRQVFRPYGSRQTSRGLTTLFQTWDFYREHYDVSFFVIEEGRSGLPKVHVSKTSYYAVSLTRLKVLLRKAGFKKVRRLDEAFYQPLLLGRA